MVKNHDALKMARTPRAKRRSRTASHVDDTTRHDGVRRAAQARVHQAKQYVLVEEKRAKKKRLWSDDRTKYSAQRRANQADTDATDMGYERMSIRVSFPVLRAKSNAERRETCQEGKQLREVALNLIEAHPKSHRHPATVSPSCTHRLKDDTCAATYGGSCFREKMSVQQRDGDLRTC